MKTFLVPNSGSRRDGKRHWIVVSTLSTLTAITMVVGCSNVEFEKGVGTGSVGPTIETPCSPIGGYFPSTENGMYGDIIVQDPNVCESSGLNSCNSHQEMTSGQQGVKVSDIVVSAPLVATRPFDRGFESRSGGLLVYPGTSTPVVEFWGLSLRTKIALAPGEPEGDYQFSVMVDDGFRLTREDTGEVLLNLEGVNSTTLVAATTTIRLRQGERIPFKLHYYQTPRTEIAFLMHWRRCSGACPSEPEHMVSNGGDYYFNWPAYTPAGGSPPTANYNNFLSRGWRPMRPENFWMPDNLVHSCI